jgi:hypothetical protein
MRLCPYCHTEVIEDAPFCPECRHSLAVTGQAATITGQAVEGKSKKKLAVIIACIIASIVIVVLVTHPPTSMGSEPPIPAHFTTYTDELGLFSISYPPELELGLEFIDEQATQNIISSMNSGLPIEETYTVFNAGLTMQGAVVVAVEPLPCTVSKHDQMVTAAIEGIKLVSSDYQELSRVRTTVDGRPATIVEYNFTPPWSGPTLRSVTMLCMVHRNLWAVGCSTLPDEYSNWEDTFDAIVRNLRILQ